MRHIRSRGSRWYIRFYDAGRTPKEKTVSLPKDSFTRRQIKQKRDQLYARWHNDDPEDDPWNNAGFGKGTAGEGAAAPALTTMQAVGRYVEAKKAAGERGERGGWSKASVGPRQRVLESFASEEAPRLARELRTEHVHALVYGRDLAQSTRRGYWRKVKAMLRWWASEGLIEPSPAEASEMMPPKPRPDQRLPAFVSARDLFKICSALDRITEEHAAQKHVPDAYEGRAWMKDAWWFAFFQGLRRQIIVDLRVRSIDFAGARLYIGDQDASPKGGKHAMIPLVPEARPIAEKWAAGAAPAERLFHHADPERLSKAFTECARRAVPEKPRLTFHKLRSGCAVYWLRRGARLPYVQRLLRHESVETTMRYLPLIGTDLKDELTRVSIMTGTPGAANARVS